MADRGENRVAGGGQDLTTYARAPGSGANDVYTLRNDKTVGLYGGLEVQLWTIRTKMFFMNIAGAAYLSPGNAASHFICTSCRSTRRAATSPSACAS